MSYNRFRKDSDPLVWHKVALLLLRKLGGDSIISFEEIMAEAQKPRSIVLDSHGQGLRVYLTDKPPVGSQVGGTIQ